MDREQTKALRRALQEGESRALVRSAFAVPGQLKSKVTRAVKKRFGKDVEVLYQTAPEVISGIELKYEGFKIAWSVGDYLELLEAELAQAIEEEAREQDGPEKGKP